MDRLHMTAAPPASRQGHHASVPASDVYGHRDSMQLTFAEYDVAG